MPTHRFALGVLLLPLLLAACGGGGGGGSAPRISAPAAGAFWSGQREIRWTPLDQGKKVVIEVSSGGPWTAISGQTEDDGRFRWDTQSVSDAGNYRVRVRSDAGVIVSGVFTVDNTAPVVTLSSPTGGELWGGYRDVTWSTTEANPDYVDIMASEDGGVTYSQVVSVATPDDGLESWDTSTLPDGAAYRVQLVATDKAGNTSVPATSTADFTLDNTAPVVTLTAPVGGEAWDLERSITWTTTDLHPGTVELRLSIDGGGSFDQLITQDTPDTGSFAWQTGYAPDGTQMRVQVQAMDGAGNVSAPDSSATDFTITNLRLIAPLHYLDVNGNATIDAGDELYLLFDKDIVVNGAGSNDLSLPVVGDGFGSGAVLAQGPELHSLVVTLGTSPTLRTRGQFDPAELSSGRPGAVDIATAMTPDAIEDAATGRDAAPSGPKDIIGGFVALPALVAGSDMTSRGALGDLDGDGDLDLVVGSRSGGLDRRYSGDGAGGWILSQSFGGGDTFDVALGDLDGDGDLDLVEAAAGANTVWFNDGSGNLVDSGESLGSSESHAVVLGDWDGDGDLDAAFGNSSGQAGRIWFNDGLGSFVDSGQALGQADTEALAAGDLDGDGDLDLVAGNRDELSRAWLNDGQGGFSAGGGATLTAVQDVALGDLDGDGNLDAYFAVLGQNEVVLGDGSGGFLPTHDYMGNNDHRAVALLDLDRDGDLDAVTAKYLDAERYWINDGSGIFSEDPRRGEPDDSTDVLVGHLDSDADLDLLLVNNLHAHRTYLSSVAGGQPQAAYSDSGASLGSWRSGRATSGDVNGDGALDIVVPDRDGAVQVLLGDGHGGLAPAAAFGVSDGRSGDLFDADGDGDLDYLQRIGDPGAGTDQLWFGDGSGSFSGPALALGLDSLYAGDLDRDGDSDLIVAGTSSFQVWAGDGSGGFAPSGPALSASGLVYGAVFDLDGDGDRDFVYGRSGDAQVWAGDGSGGFTLAGTLTPGGTVADLSVTDYDRDGDLDLIFATDLGLSVLRNDGGLSFTSRGITGPSGSLSQVYALDLNEDGYSDYLVVDETLSSFFLCIGNGTDTIPAPVATVVSNLAAVLPVDLDGDGDPDLYWSRDDALTPAGVADRVDLFD